jgi:hypothetical protein
MKTLKAGCDAGREGTGATPRKQLVLKVRGVFTETLWWAEM